MAGHALIIEDEAIIALELEDRLRELGFRTFDVAVSPTEAIDHALRRKPDLITADVRIVGGTGIEAVHAIEAQVGHVPHIYITGNVDLLGDEDGAVVVEKPVRSYVLAQAWATAIAAH